MKERYWVSFAPGEIRTCAVCHGVNTADQAGNLGAPQNKPDALRTLLQFWKANHPSGAMQHSTGSAAVDKKAGVVTLSVTRAGGSTGPVSVAFSTVNGTALAGTDFAAASGTLNWADGDTAPKLISIPLLNNAAVGPDKTFSVTLSGPLYGSLGAVKSSTVTIQEPPLGAWIFAKFGAAANTPAIGALDADPDGDGASNLAEFAFNTDPAAPASVPLFSPALSIDPVTHAQSVTLSFHRRKPPREITYHVETSADLVTWSESTVQELSATDAGDGVTDLVMVRAVAPAGAGQAFVRLRVTSP